MPKDNAFVIVKDEKAKAILGHFYVCLLHQKFVGFFLPFKTTTPTQATKEEQRRHRQEKKDLKVISFRNHLKKPLQMNQKLLRTLQSITHLHNIFLKTHTVQPKRPLAPCSMGRSQYLRSCSVPRRSHWNGRRCAFAISWQNRES